MYWSRLQLECIKRIETDETNEILLFLAKRCVKNGDRAFGDSAEATEPTVGHVECV